MHVLYHKVQIFDIIIRVHFCIMKRRNYSEMEIDMVTPDDILQYVLDNKLESDFMVSLMMHKEGYSIGEISDKRFTNHDGVCKFISKAFNINVVIEDDQIVTAIINGLYITPFISRRDNDYNVHFLVHQYPESMKEQFEEDIASEVVRYMIKRTIVALRLDSEAKIDKYIGRK